MTEAHKSPMPFGLASTDGLGPLPDYAPEFRPRWFGDDGGFTGAQMREYARQEVSTALRRVADRAANTDATGDRNG